MYSIIIFIIGLLTTVGYVVANRKDFLIKTTAQRGYSTSTSTKTGKAFWRGLTMFVVFTLLSLFQPFKLKK